MIMDCPKFKKNNKVCYKKKLKQKSKINLN